MKIKLFTILFSILLFVIIFSGCVEDNKNNSSNVSKNLEFDYMNNYLNFGINLSDNWDYYGDSYHPTKIYINIPDEDRLLFTIELQDPIIYDSGNLKENLESNLRYSDIQINEILVKDMEAYEYSSTHSLYFDGYNYSIKYIYITKFDKVFTLTYEAPVEIYNEYYSEINDSINSFTIFKGGPYDHFSIGDTVKWGDLEVTVHSASRIYSCTKVTSSGETYTDSPDSNQKFILLDIEVENKVDESVYISVSDFEIWESIDNSSHYSYSGDYETYYLLGGFESANIEKSQKIRGNILFALPIDSTNLTINFDFSNYCDCITASWDLDI